MDITNRPPLPDPGEVWDHLLTLAQTRQNLKPCDGERSSLVKLHLLHPEPKQVHLPGLRRSLAEIDPALREAMRACIAAKSPWPLFLHGRAGIGKSCAALCLLDYSGGEYWTAARFCELLNDALFGRLIARGEGGSVTIWPDAIWRRVQQAPLMVLDELGQRLAVSEPHYDAVKRVLDERQDKPLIVISNVDSQGIDRLYDERISSRLGAGTIVELRGRDRRIEP